MAKKGVTIGLDYFHYAIMNDDETYGTPKRIPGAIQATVTPTTNSTTLYADDKADEVATSLGDIAVVLGVKDIPTEDHAAMLGHTIDSNGVLVRSSGDTAPYVAIGYRRRKSNGKYRYVWLYKGKFQPEAQEAQTKPDTPAFQTPTINATFVPRDDNGDWQSVVDEDDTGVPGSVITNWFSNVYLKNADTTAPTVTVVPANNATAVAVAADVVWTFSKAIRSSDVHSGNFIVQKADGSGVVAGTLTLDVTEKIVTFDPATNLTAATLYLATVTTGVHDMSGNALAATSTTKFTTA